MQTEPKNPTPSLAGGTELLVLAPLRQGLVPALESVSYKTRTKLLLKALHSGRKSAHEYQLFRALSDAVERVGVIHTLRVAVLEPQDQVLLSVNFDGAYESYVRVIWQKASRLLDLIFCNTEGYPLGWRSSHAVWRDWLRRVQVDTPFFYALPGQTYQDAQYLRMHEQSHRRGADDLAMARLAVPSAERIAWDIVLQGADPTAGTAAKVGDEGVRAGIRQGLQGLAGIHRLSDLYPPDGDGQVLLDAAHELLPEFSRMQRIDDFAGITDQVGSRFTDQLAWFRQPLALPSARVPPPLQAAPLLPLANVQAGILRPVDDVSHGCLCLVTLDGPAAATALLDRLVPALTTGDADLSAPGSIAVQMAFSAEGLRACGLDEDELDWLPPEFRQGMDARAGLLGDIGPNHPRRWTLPLRNWPAALNPAWRAPAGTAPVAPQAVHLVLQLRFVAGPGFAARAGAQAALAARALALLDGLPGVLPLSVQWMARATAGGGVIDHFGFTDGQSQPVFDQASAGQTFANQVAPGEVLLGHDNAADHAADLSENQHPARRALLRDGSFLVLRKLRQNVGVLRSAVDAVPHQRALVLAKMMGRWPLGDARAGKPLVSTPAGNLNDFDYSGDADGAQCPLSAHIRLANPRTLPQTAPSSQLTLASIPGARPPRLIRRSMPYGPVAPPWPAAGAAAAGAEPVSDDDDRGLLFMAYNASIGEQFEVVQRWLAGGNSSGMVSAHADPFTAVAQAGRQRHFRFSIGNTVVRMPLDGSQALGDPATAIVALQWGFYLFAPARSGLAWLRGRAAAAAAAAPALPWSAVAGEHDIAGLMRLAQTDGADAAAAAWKLALEDIEAVGDWRSASIWAAIRQLHGGALATPYGVLVGSRELVDAVLRNDDGRYTVDGYQRRLHDSIGPIYLGLDDGPDYQREAAACNREIQNITFDDGFDQARRAAELALDGWVGQARDLAIDEKAARWDLTLDVRELVDEVLATLCENWFGLSEEGGFLKRGSFAWEPIDSSTGAPDLRPRYPGHFTAISRATFQPAPGAAASALARSQGQALTKAMHAFLTGPGAATQAPVTRAVLNDCGADTDRAARTVAGALMGLLPTTAGNLRRILGDWLQDGVLWRLQAELAGAADWDVAATAMQRLHAPLLRTMQARPVPELIWRTARHAHVLQHGTAMPCPVDAGAKVVLGLVSATQQGLETGATDVLPAFGGARGAAATSPTHACPGYMGAMGVIVGLLAAVLARGEELRPGPAPGVLYFEGPTDAAALAGAPAIGQAGLLVGMQANGAIVPAGAAAAPRLAPRLLQALRGRAGVLPQGKLLGWGDSWIFNLASGDRSLGEALAALGWDTSSFPAHSRMGAQLLDMAAEPVSTTQPGSIFHAVRTALVAADDPDDPQALPRAIIVSGGGNDVHKRQPDGSPPPLREMLNSAADVAAGAPLFTAAKDSFIQQRLARDLRTVLRNLTGVTQGRIPVLVQGYDHPIPDRRRHSLLVGPWLWPSITGDRGHDPQTTGRQIMRTLIDELNTAYATVVAEFAALNVHHAPLAGELALQPGYAQDYTLWWSNELHPTAEGFSALARKLVGLIPPVAPLAEGGDPGV